MLTALGALILLVLRSTDRKLQPYTTPLDRLNLALLVVLGALSAAVALTPPGMAGVAAAMGRILRLQAPEVSTLLAAPDGRRRAVPVLPALHPDGPFLLQVLHLSPGAVG